MESKRKNENEHILVCLSASPSNAKIIRTAAKMAQAFGGSFTALYVKTPNYERMDDAAKYRLQTHIQLAEQLGATIATVHGEEIPFQIAEYARISNVTKIVIGRSNIKRRHFWSKPTLTEKLTEIAPNIDIHIIPDSTTRGIYDGKSYHFLHNFIPYPKDLLITVMVLFVSTFLGNILYYFGFNDSNIIPVYILGVLLTSLFTRGYFCSIIASLLSVMLFNYFFTVPRLTFHAYDSKYAVTFAIMLASSIITGTLASKLKSHAKLSAQAAFRTKVLLDTNQLLQKAQDIHDIFNITATQLMKLLNRSIVMYMRENGKLTTPSLFAVDTKMIEYDLLTPFEYSAAYWVYNNLERAGVTTEKFSTSKCLYLPIRINNYAYGVVGIHIIGKTMDSFEMSILLSILGECALALDNNRNAKEKELAAILAKNEQLRADLLRSISHDLRTPLTSISGNAGNLLTNYKKLDEETRTQAFTDIYEDSQWLISLVENLLSVTRIDEGRMNFNMSVQLLEEVVEEAIKHISRKALHHQIITDYKSDLILAPMDAKLIIQVIINLIDNAIKYTPRGSIIRITVEEKDGFVYVSVSDNGNGIPDHMKPRVFEMFYTGDSKIADSRRSLGLGLPLCKSIIHAHNGEIKVTDNDPKGCVFTFTIPSGEVNINE